jgi:hypothetical protein
MDERKVLFEKQLSDCPVICAFGMLLAITLQYLTLAFHDEYLKLLYRY